MPDADLRQAAERLAAAGFVFAVTGAGMSAESGIPTFRGAGGLWEGFRAEELATPEAFADDPERVWRWYRWRLEKYRDCEPNPGHHTLAEIERAKPGFYLATQNVDGLHRRAGSQEMSEIHGCIELCRCTDCATIGPIPPENVASDAPMPYCADCGGLCRPHVLWFGETYWPGVLERASAAAEKADVVLVIGTSAQVWPPAQLAMHGQRSGGFLIDVNPDRTTISRVADIHLPGRSGEILPALWELAQR